MIMTGRIPAVIDGEIATDQVGAHSGAFASKRLATADSAGLIFAVVNTHRAGVAAGVREGVVGWFGPVAAVAEAWTVSVASVLRDR